MKLILNSSEIIFKQVNVTVLVTIFAYSFFMVFFVFSVEDGESLDSAFKISYNIINLSLSILFISNFKSELKNGVAARKLSNGYSIYMYFSEKQVQLFEYTIIGVIFYLLESILLSIIKDVPVSINFELMSKFFIGVCFTANLMLSIYLITTNLFVGFFGYFFLAIVEKSISNYTKFISPKVLPIGSISDIGKGNINSIYIALIYCTVIFFLTLFVFKTKKRWDY